MEIRVVVNPTAGAGSAGRRVLEISTALNRAGLRHEIVETRRPGDATRLVREARGDGADVCAIVGGDGTINEAVQAYIDESGAPVAGPDLALIPAGTGGDFRKTFRIPEDVDGAVERLRSADPRPIDLGVLHATADSGERVTRAFANIMSFGLGGLTDRLVNKGPKWMGGRAAFFIGSLRATFAYRNAPVTVRVDGKPMLEGPILNVAVANGRYFGGGMKIAPEADPSDGLFDIVALVDLTRAQGIALAADIYRGSHPGRPGVHVGRGRVVQAEPLRADREVLIDMDGETPGRLPLEARILPSAVRIRA